MLPYKNVLVDMDNVIADFDGRIMSSLRERYPHVVHPSSRQNFHIADDYPGNRGTIKSLYREPGFFKNLPVVEGAVEGLRRINALGYAWQICTSSIPSNPLCKAEKKQWVETYLTPEFGTDVAEQMIVTDDKYRYHGIALIDDKPVIASSESADWEHVVFDRPYNKDVTNRRISGWSDPHLEALLLSASRNYRAIGKIAANNYGS